MISLSKSEKETQKIAGKLALKVIKIKKPVIIALEGELGAGKTTFVKGFAKALGINAKVKSPTFTLMKKYEIFSSGKTQNTGTKAQIKHPPAERAGKTQKSSKTQNPTFLIHLDCYRVRDHRDLATLDLKSLFKSPDNIILIEWPERVSKILPKKLITVHIDHVSENKRRISIQ